MYLIILSLILALRFSFSIFLKVHHLGSDSCIYYFILLKSPLVGIGLKILTFPKKFELIYLLILVICLFNNFKSKKSRWFCVKSFEVVNDFFNLQIMRPNLLSFDTCFDLIKSFFVTLFFWFFAVIEYGVYLLS